MSNSGRKGIIGVFVLILVFFIIFMIFAVYTMKSFQGSLKEDVSFDKGDEPIGVVEVLGAIMDSKSVVKKLHLAEKSKSIKAIIVRIDSPGGAVGPTQEIYHEMRRIDENVKPVYASFGSMAASGGYYIGAAARKIFSNAGTLTGSIGVIMHFMNLSKLYEFAKVSPEVVKAGKYKDIGNPARAFTPEEQALMRGMISGVHDQFRDDILKTREKKIKGSLEDHTQGQIFSGAQAKELGLVDEIGSLWQAARWIHKEHKIEEKFGIHYLKLPKKFDWTNFLSDIEQTIEDFKWGALNRIPLLMYAPR